MKYRMYVDEVGNSDMSASQNPNHRYLSLTGVIIELDYVNTTVFPCLEELKRKYFGSHPDEPIILHRKELVNQKPPFDSLRDARLEAEFNAELLSLLTDLDYVVITAVIDKLEHNTQYTAWRFDPYHYCLTVLVERYVQWLETKATKGDVMAESRGGNEDKRLKASFERLYEQGSDYVTPDQLTEWLTSRQLKVKPKSTNIAGLQLADIIAHPSYKAVLARRNNQALPENFGGQISQILVTTKYRRSPSGKIDGWGIKWLP